MSNPIEIPLGDLNLLFGSEQELIVETFLRTTIIQVQLAAMREVLLKNAAIIQERSYDEVEAEYILSLHDNHKKIANDLSENYPPPSS